MNLCKLMNSHGRRQRRTLKARDRRARNEVTRRRRAAPVEDRRRPRQNVSRHDARIFAADGGRRRVHDEPCLVRAEDELAEKYEGLWQSGRAR